MSSWRVHVDAWRMIVGLWLIEKGVFVLPYEGTEAFRARMAEGLTEMAERRAMKKR